MLAIAIVAQSLAVVGSSGRLIEDLFGRPPYLKVFVSSQMTGRVLSRERQAAIETIDGLGFARRWAWELDASAGPYCSERVCLGHARTSDGLVLILAETLTRVTEMEYFAAKANGVPCYILCKERVTRDAKTRHFITKERQHSITVNFRNVPELRSHVVNALYTDLIQAVRRDRRRRYNRRLSPLLRVRIRGSR